MGFLKYILTVLVAIIARPMFLVTLVELDVPAKMAETLAKPMTYWAIIGGFLVLQLLFDIIGGFRRKRR